MRILALSLFFFVCASSIFAQMEKPVEWSFETKKIDNGVYDVYFNADINGSWYLYSQHLGGESGPVPTAFAFEKMDGCELVGDVEEIGNPIHKFDDMFSMELKYYRKNVTFRQRIKIEEDAAFTTGYLTFMTCNNDRCMPPTDIDFSFDLAK